MPNVHVSGITAYFALQQVQAKTTSPATTSSTSWTPTNSSLLFTPIVPGSNVRIEAAGTSFGNATYAIFRNGVMVSDYFVANNVRSSIYICAMEYLYNTNVTYAVYFHSDGTSITYGWATYPTTMSIIATEYVL